jgi:hypothetical protein
VSCLSASTSYCTLVSYLVYCTLLSYLIKKERKTNLSEDWERYRCLRNCVTNKIKVAKGRYNRQLIEENTGDPKAFWKMVKSFLEKLKKCLQG